MPRQQIVVACLFVASLMPVGPIRADHVPDGYRLIYSQDFESPHALNDFVFANPANWTVARHDGNGMLEFTGASRYNPTVRSPKNIALLTWRRVGDFVLECQLMQTGKDYGHRDMCLFFNFQAPDRYYYSHIATKTDEHAHNIFIVNAKPRTKISTKTTAGVDWGRGQWHKVRIERNCQSGSIKVYYDDMTTPIMTATDTTFKEGWVGFGSFDDTGRIDNIKLWAPGEPKAWRPRCFPTKPVTAVQPPPPTTGPGFKPLFDGRTLHGWKPLNGTARYRVADGCIVATADPKGRLNSYLSTVKTYRDFILACEVKFDKFGNSGIQIRSRQRKKDGLVTGYQIEIDDSDRRWSGGLYEERGRGWMTPLVGPTCEKARQAFKRDDWNTMIIRARGNHIQTWVNGTAIADYYDNDKALAGREGFIGLQVHWPVEGKVGQMRWRHLRIKELND